MGEVTQQDISFLSSILEEVLPEYHHKLQTETPEYGAAFGAACFDYGIHTTIAYSTPSCN